MRSDFVWTLTEKGYKREIGKLPEYSEEEIALYPLDEFPTTFDFCVFAAVAKTCGLKHVRFSIEERIADHKYPPDIAWKRFGNILVPVCSMAGLTYSVGEPRPGVRLGYYYGDAIYVYENLRTWSPLRQVIATPKRGYYTITLRDSIRNKWRDSDRDSWMRVKDDLESRGERVIVFDDCEYNPIDIQERMAVYCQAKLNMGTGGPMALCDMSLAPYLHFVWADDSPSGEALRIFHQESRFPFGSQLPFRTKYQKFVWEKDTYENITRALDEFDGCTTSGKAEGIQETLSRVGNISLQSLQEAN